MNIYNHGFEIDWSSDEKLIPFSAISCLMTEYRPDTGGTVFLVVCSGITIRITKSEYEKLYEHYKLYLQRT